jgi:hypothetical protein
MKKSWHHEGWHVLLKVAIPTSCTRACIFRNLWPMYQRTPPPPFLIFQTCAGVAEEEAEGIPYPHVAPLQLGSSF